MTDDLRDKEQGLRKKKKLFNGTAFLYMYEF